MSGSWLCLLAPYLAICKAPAISTTSKSSTLATSTRATSITVSSIKVTSSSAVITSTRSSTSLLPSSTARAPSSTFSTSTTRLVSSTSSVSLGTVSITPSSTTIIPSVSSPTSSVIISSSSTRSSPVSQTSSSSASLSSTSSSSASSSSSTAVPTHSSSGSFSGSIDSTILVIAGDAVAANVATRGLNGYGIPHEVLVVPATGGSLPSLNSSGSGLYGGIIVVDGVVHDYGASGYISALTTDQWNELYAYQMAYGVRMVQYGLFPTADYGVTALGGCCASGVDQLFSFTNTTAFVQAGLSPNAGVSTSGLYHYPATITNTSNTFEVAQFAPSTDGSFSTSSTAAVINDFGGRQQMVFFIGFAQDWSPSSSFMQHAYITWMTRGLYAGYRRVNLNTQIDDVMLATDIYYPAGIAYRTTADDFAGISAWIPSINAKMPAGSDYRPELGYNGNGNIIYSENTTAGEAACSPGSIEYDEIIDTPLEFQKPLGTGKNFWPDAPTSYGYSRSCLSLDPLEVWLTTPSNKVNFNHISHTFTHEELNNATYSDALKEIKFNQAWLSQTGISANRFTSNGLIPPAITGLHNGDALRAWSDAGLTNCVGDNTRPVLVNAQNDMWPYVTTVATNGFDGFQVNPRWATRIYYNCDTGACTTQEWIDTSAGSGTFADLLAVEKQDTSRHMFGLYHDPYMFHQANLRNTGNMGTTTVNGATSTISIFQAWVETVVQEFVRLANWPIITLQQSEFSASFADRMTRDQCNYKLAYTVRSGAITGVSVTAINNQCSSPIPVTFPGPVSNTQGFKTEQVGNDPLTVWVTLSGSPVTLSMAKPLSLLS